KPGEEIVRFKAQVFETKQVLEGLFLFPRNTVTKRNKRGVLASDGITQAVSLDTEIVPNSAFERNLFDGRGPQVASRGSEPEFRGPILERFEDKLNRRLVGSPVRVRQLKVVGSTVFETEVR